MAFCNHGRMFRRLFDLRKSAVSSAKSSSWTLVVGHGISFMYAEYSRSVELRGTPALHENEPAQLMWYHTLSEYRSEVAASVVSFRPVNESSGGSLPTPIPTQEVDNAPVTRLRTI
ncbi:hypothetical protein EVAR_92496_1 [Eumeta japonica]|uniref:Uncharacterized protein n=1 Tax=Eumeta variegata TaxID=151549 RepID=A0A4C1T752_EUMVA|nr:hypothetical protein EVAR_92496_1 [Eumeta japonica]